MQNDNFFQRGKIFVFEYENEYYLFSGVLNQVFETTKTVYDEFISKQAVDKGRFPEEISKLIVNSDEKNVVPDVYLNVSSGKVETKSLVIKQILTYYNYCNKLYLIIEINHNTVFLLKEILEWVNGYERLIVVCQFAEETDLKPNILKEDIFRIKKMYDTRIIIEPYFIYYNINDNEVSKKIKISSLLSSNILNSGDEQNIISIINKSILSKNFNQSLKLSLKIRPSVIVSVSDEGIITTNKEHKCNNCWAKITCHSNQYYKMFSSHPYICSINSKNCGLIKNSILNVVKKNINIQKQIIDNKLSNKSISINSNCITLLNP